MLVGVLSVFIGGPFLVKSAYYTGTPLYPFFFGIFPPHPRFEENAVAWQSLQENSKLCLNTKDQYGSGRSFIDFISHWWLIAIPEDGVNNRYDYPVGLVYLLCLGPFIYLFCQSVKKRTFCLLPIFVIAYWISWWQGSQQTRFLFIPLVLMALTVLIETKFHSRVFQAGILLALFLVTISIFRTHRSDFGVSPMGVLREKDRKLLELSKTVDANRSVTLDFYDVAFAEFPVEVKGVKSVFVLEH